MCSYPRSAFSDCTILFLVVLPFLACVSVLPATWTPSNRHTTRKRMRINWCENISAFDRTRKQKQIKTDEIGKCNFWSNTIRTWDCYRVNRIQQRNKRFSLTFNYFLLYLCNLRFLENREALVALLSSQWDLLHQLNNMFTFTDRRISTEIHFNCQHAVRWDWYEVYVQRNLHSALVFLCGSAGDSSCSVSPDFHCLIRFSMHWIQINGKRTTEVTKEIQLTIWQ